MTRTVRTKFTPDVEVEVDDAEYLDLSRLDLLVEDQPSKTRRAPAPAADKE